MDTHGKRNILIGFLLGLTIFLRLYHIGDTAEFLGDQGRDGLAVISSLTQSVLPVRGPTVGAGYYTGPMYYYIIAPSYFLFPNTPLAPIVEISIVSGMAVLLFLFVASQLFGFRAAYVVSLLWSVSPMLIMQDRRLWNPTLIPFFVLLLIASGILVFRKKKYWAYGTAAFAAVTLIELHYVNAISVLFVGIIWIWMEILASKQRSKKTYLWIVGAAVIIACCIGPFLWYESHHAFSDMTGSLTTFLHGTNQAFSKRAYVQAVYGTTVSVWKYIVVLQKEVILFAIGVFVLAAHAIKKSTATKLLALWFCFGIGVLALYKDTIQEQYWYQLIPVIFLLLTGVLSFLHKRTAVTISIFVVLFVGVISWSARNPYMIEDPDLPRIAAIADKVSEVTRGQPFAFTLMHSRSFSDLHIRYFLHIRHLLPVSIDDVSNTTLLIICENGCDEKPKTPVTIMCSTEICPLDKPTVNFEEWTYQKTERIGKSAMYIYTR